MPKRDLGGDGMLSMRAHGSDATHSSLLIQLRSDVAVTIRRCWRKIRFSIWVGIVCWLPGLLAPSPVICADDAVESTSVIPIQQTTEQKTGIPIEVKTLADGTSSRKTRYEAVNQFPFGLMTPESQAIARQIQGNLTLYRRLPLIQFDVDRRTYEYFTEHPDVAVSIWREMEISRVTMAEKSPMLYETDTQDGTRGIVEVLLRSPEHYIVVCRGEFKNPALKTPIKAVAMMHLQPVFSESGLLTHQLDMYVSLPSDAIAFIAKMISPISNRIADRNFEEISLFVRMMSVAMQRQPGWVESLAEGLDGISDSSREKLLQTTAEVYVDAVKAERLRMGEVNVSVEDILPPIRDGVIPASSAVQAVSEPQTAVRH